MHFSSASAASWSHTHCMPQSVPCVARAGIPPAMRFRRWCFDSLWHRSVLRCRYFSRRQFARYIRVAHRSCGSTDSGSGWTTDRRASRIRSHSSVRSGLEVSSRMACAGEWRGFQGAIATRREVGGVDGTWRTAFYLHSGRRSARAELVSTRGLPASSCYRGAWRRSYASFVVALLSAIHCLGRSSSRWTLACLL
jgi:hypothetical protein